MITVLFVTSSTFVDYLGQMTDNTFDTLPDNWNISPAGY